MKNDWSHDKLAHDLAMHLYAGGDHVVWENIDVAGDGSRPDVFTFNKSYNAPAFVSYEIKTSPADLRGDLTSGKWQKYQRYSSGVTFAVPQGLCTKDDVPAVCGLIVRGERIWRHVRKPKLQAFTLSTYTMVKLMHQGRFRAPEEKRDWNDMNGWRLESLERRAMQKIGERYGRDIAMYLKAPQEAREIVAKAKEEAAKIIKHAKDHAEVAGKSLKMLRDGFCRVIGVREGAPDWEIERAINARLSDLSKDRELARMIDWFKAQREVCNSALGPYERKTDERR